MCLWNSLCGWFGTYDNHTMSSATGCEINPATALPMVGCIDIAGNPYGMDLHNNAGQTDSMGADWDSAATSSLFDTSSWDFGSTWDN